METNLEIKEKGQRQRGTIGLCSRIQMDLLDNNAPSSLLFCSYLLGRVSS